ncbi:helix-turn-helix domain-containing protein [Trichocoleus sp. FACHB-591]|uniref:helix-turn-helix domain-containing protein n=1 Tax=Trichocoleus sp. FACHB-591 TaxID=2692872 RepID=UPI0018EF4A0C|nr:helix-turn-helix domain-containing protein [Trichocoleus sp. FACHB-591]
MAGVYQLEITESEAELKQLLRQQKTASAKERVQLLYLLKSEQADTVQAAAQLLGRHRATAQEWLRRYREDGLAKMLQTQARSGRPRAIPQWAETALQKRLEAPEGFDGYQAICDWLEAHLGLEMKYKTVHKLVHYRLQASPKVPRPLSVEQSCEQREAYKKT